MIAFARAAFDGSAIERPREISLTVDIGRANLAGIDVKGVSGTFKLDPAGVTFDNVRIADLADAAFNLNGRMEGALDAPRGTVTFDVDARGLDGTIAVLAKYLPEAAEPLRHAAAHIVPLKARATLGIEPVSSTDPRGNSKVKLGLEGTAGALRTKIRRRSGRRSRRVDAAGVSPRWPESAPPTAPRSSDCSGSTARSMWTSAPAR